MNRRPAVPHIWLTGKGESTDSTVGFDSADYSKKLAGTDFTIEDLAMRSLYWQDAEFIGEDKIKGQDTKIVRVKNPDQRGPYQ
ncbi:hypothetical protein [Rubritalea sp.]|uniref:hypothetical protein n=1 Tax=Rubritalea sp. TaxID=2109375 RepID=UPI003EF2412A